jgi:alpha-glucosidase
LNQGKREKSKVKHVWWKEAVAYQIYPRSFMDSNGDGIGDLRGIIAKLDYLKELGIDVLWVCPFFKSPNDDNGYDISDYQDIMDEFGTMQDFDDLLREVHARGMKIILDLVINHTSDEHPWFIESRSSKDNPKRDWYIWADGKPDGSEPNNWDSIFHGSAWLWDEHTEQYFMHIFSKRQPDLNWENPEVRFALYDMVNWWLDKGIDGFRVDAISHIKKIEGYKDLPNPKKLQYVNSTKGHCNRPGIHDFLAELKRETFDKYDIMTVGEASGVTTDDVHLWVSEEEGKFHMIFQFEHLTLWSTDVGAGFDLVKLKKTLSSWQNKLHGSGWNALFLENHDLARLVSTWGNDEEYRVQSAKAFATMYFFMQGTPFIYQGQEIGMTNARFDSIDDYDDVGMKNLYHIETAKGRPHLELMEIIWKKGRDNSRTPMQWNDSLHAGFTTGTPWMKCNPNYTAINVEADLKNPDSVLNYYKTLIQVRKQQPTLVYGKYDLILPRHKRIFAYTRTEGQDTFLIITNLFGEETTFQAPRDLKFKEAELIVSTHPVSENDNVRKFALKPYEARVYRLK